MGYKTPNIDRIAREGALFTDWYGAAELHRRPRRLHHRAVADPHRPDQGRPARRARGAVGQTDPTIAELLKPLGYATGQFGKNHLGDRNEHLPTVHGFDEFFGNLYHLNAEEEPENIDYPKNPAFKGKFGPRGVLHCYATALEEAGEDPRFGAWGKQRCEDTGPLTAKRMETVDREFLTAAHGFIDKAHQANKPFFVWYNTTRMHIWTHLAPEARGQDRHRRLPRRHGRARRHGRRAPGQARRARHRRRHDRHVRDRQRRRGDELAGRRHHAVPRREEHQLGGRLPRAVADPLAGRDQAGHDPQRGVRARGHAADAAGRGRRAGRRGRARRPASRSASQTYKVHLDGYDLRALPQGRGRRRAAQGVPLLDRRRPARRLRYDQWKLNFLEQRAHGFDVWEEPFVELRLPKLFTLRGDPFERADHEGIGYPRWRIDRAFMLVPAQVYVSKWLQSFAQFPPRMKAASFGIDQVMQAITEGKGGN